MSYLAAAVVLVGLIGAVNLVLAYGIIRRLREHTEQLAQLPSTAPAPDIMLPVGSTPGELPDVTATSGTTMSGDSLSAGSLIGFFSPGCPACKEQAPRFVELAAKLPKERVLAVAVGAEDDMRDLVASFEAIATVALEAFGGPLQQAFAVKGFPAICVVSAGQIVGSSTQVRELSELAGAMAASAGQPQPA